MKTVIIATGQSVEPVIVSANSVDGSHNSRSTIQVFDEIHTMMSKVLLWNSMVFIDWRSKEELDSSSDFVKLCLSFIEKNRSRLSDNVYFGNSEMKEIEEAYYKIEGKIESYYSSMDKPNLMADNKTTLAIVSFFHEIPVKELEIEAEDDGCPFK